MRIVLFCHSLVSDWNHGNAHFLRGTVSELVSRSHDVRVYEPADGWSRQHLVRAAGPRAIAGFHRAFPHLTSRAVDLTSLDLEEALDGADLVIVHEWNPHELVERVGRHKARGGRYVLLFHDTHHRSVTDARTVAAYDLRHYDGVLAFGNVIRERYVASGWARRAWTWHEAADTRLFKPLDRSVQDGDLVWVGNWGDDERSAEIRAYLIEPVTALRLRADVYGVRYPPDATRELEQAGVRYAGWLPNYEAPRVFARHRMTVHIPRRPYVEWLPGIPTIRVFEALACAIPLVSVHWEDAEHLFRPGEDYLVARTPREMQDHLRTLLHEPGVGAAVAGRGLETIRRRHTCAHRVDELLEIVQEIRGGTREVAIA